jgi:hypothetical protein
MWWRRGPSRTFVITLDNIDGVGIDQHPDRDEAGSLFNMATRKHPGRIVYMVERIPLNDGRMWSHTICWHKPEFLKPLPKEAEELEHDLRCLALESKEDYVGERLDKLARKLEFTIDLRRGLDREAMKPDIRKFLNEMYDRQITRIKAYLPEDRIIVDDN